MPAPARILAALSMATLFSATAAAAPMTRDHVTVSDMLGRPVRLPAVAARIVSLAPNITEILFALGAGHQVVGVTDFCDRPPEARTRARVGGFVNPSLEVIAGLRPDLVVATRDGNRSADVGALERMGLAVAVLDTDTPERLLQSIELLATLSGHPGEGSALTGSLRSAFEDTARRMTGLKAPRVLFLVGTRPLVGVGPGTFVDRLLAIAGARNALAASQVRYPLLSMEGVLAVDPDVIILGALAPGEGTVDNLAGWSGLGAVRRGRVHHLDDDALLRPGPRLASGLRTLAEILHPGHFDGEAR